MSEFIHNPVLVGEVLAALRPRSDGRYVDGTVGGGGHAAAILRACGPTGRLFGCDRDGAALEAASERLAEYAGRVMLRRGSYAELRSWLETESCAGVLLDLGVSSAQLDQAGRGFSFQQDGPLDMRMDVRQTLTAAVLVNEASVDELARVFWELGGERRARRIARGIERERRQMRYESTLQLAAVIERLAPRRGSRTHPATRVFQALRLAVNDELGHLRRGLAVAAEILKPGGRLVLISFHSLEDAVVKEFGRVQTRDYIVPGEVDVPELRVYRAPPLKWITRKALRPAPDEVERNPRSRSARLRVLEKN